MGKYKNFAQMRRHEKEGTDFQIKWRKTDSTYAIVAPHGGWIEPGTGELADAIAGQDHNYYCFKGIKRKNNTSLHLASDHFDEPEAIALLSTVRTVITLHGCKDERSITHIGGSNKELITKIDTSLTENGFLTNTEPRSYLSGEKKSNLCNRGQTGQGVQLELSHTLRSQLLSADKKNCNNLKKDTSFHLFVTGIRNAIVLDHYPLEILKPKI